jgi:hypothetical protein
VRSNVGILLNPGKISKAVEVFFHLFHVSMVNAHTLHNKENRKKEQAQSISVGRLTEEIIFHTDFWQHKQQ